MNLVKVGVCPTESGIKYLISDETGAHEDSL